MGIEVPGAPTGGGIQLGGQTPTPVSGGGISLVKGAKVDLTKGNPGLDEILVGLGWDTNDGGGDSYDLDAEVFLLGANGKVVSDNHVVYYNNLKSPDGAVVHTGDNLTGEGEGDDETISIKLSQLSQDVQKIAFTVTIHNAVSKRQNFGQVNNAYIRIMDKATGQELCRYDLTEDYSTSISVKPGEIYRHNGEFKFNATGTGSTNDLSALCSEYGVQ